MRLALLAVLAWLAATPHSIAAADAAAPAPAPLRADPDRLCEASAMARLAPDTALVLDNEIDDLAFGFATDRGMLAAKKAANVALETIPDAERPRDVEAAVRVLRYLVLVGSHSRNKDCEIRPKRERILVGELAPDGTSLRTAYALDQAGLFEKIRGGADCRTTLFTNVGRTGDATAAFCRTLVEAERTAAPGHCETFAIEGAATVFENQRERLWIGLRAPLVDGKAVLLRLDSLKSFMFDATALVDLGGRGIRELASRDRKLYAIAGPPADAAAPFALYELTPQMDPQAPLTPRLVRSDLPTSSEGMLPTDDGFDVVVDGAAGDDGGACKEPARQYRLPLD